jgi:hypothetical protein
MVKWLYTNPSPPPKVAEVGVIKFFLVSFFSKFIQIKIQHRRLGLREMKGRVALITRRFENMLKDSIENCEKEWDSDDNLEDYDFQVGQEIDYL